MDPVTLYKDGKEKLIASVDVNGWLADGWSVVKPLPEADHVADVVVDESELTDSGVKTSVKRK